MPPRMQASAIEPYVKVGGLTQVSDGSDEDARF